MIATSLTPGLQWMPLDTWTVVIAALAGMASALLGCFLVLRKMSMMGDAISHAVLPGLAAAFLLTGSRSGPIMLVGAAIVGVLTAFFTEWIRRRGRVDEGAAMGVVFTVLFALGLVLIRMAADHIDLDPDCVLYGALEAAVLNTVTISGVAIPRAALVNGGILVVNVLFVVLFFKELRISSFDPALATTQGINATVMHYLLMTLVAITTVFAFETVGSILVIAMLIVPAASAQLLTERLGAMLVWSLLLVVLACVLGHAGAIVLPGAFGFPGASTSTAGMIGVFSGLIFLLSMLFAPRHGLVNRVIRQWSLSLRIICEDLLALLYRIEERDSSATHAATVILHGTIGASWIALTIAMRQLRRRGWIERQSNGLALTPTGRGEAVRLLRSHRLWESYLEKHLALRPDHVHAPAEQLEHVTTRQMQSDLAEALDQRATDPHGRPIPPAGGSDRVSSG